jgi:hypothetical protein
MDKFENGEEPGEEPLYSNSSGRSMNGDRFSEGTPMSPLSQAGVAPKEGEVSTGSEGKGRKQGRQRMFSRKGLLKAAHNLDNQIKGSVKGARAKVRLRWRDCTHYMGCQELIMPLPGETSERASERNAMGTNQRTDHLAT